MFEIDNSKIMNRVLKKNKYREFFLGKKPYRIINGRGSSPYGYDTAYGFDLISQRMSSDQLVLFLQALESIADEYNGIIPCLGILICIYPSDKHTFFSTDIDFSLIFDKLRFSITKYRNKLSCDKSGIGKDYDNGQLGDVERLCDNFYDTYGVRIL